MIGCNYSEHFSKRWLVRTLLFSRAISTAFPLSRCDTFNNSGRGRDWASSPFETAINIEKILDRTACTATLNSFWSEVRHLRRDIALFLLMSP